MKMLKHGVALLLAAMMLLNCASGAVTAHEPTLVKRVTTTQASDPAKGAIPAQELDPALAGTNVLVIPEFRNGSEPSEDELVSAIVLLEGKAVAESEEPTRSARTRLTVQHNKLRNSLQQSGISYTEQYDYMTLLNGMAVSVRYGDLEKLAAVEGVSSVHIANHYDPPEAVVKMESSNEMTGVAALQKSGFTGSGTVIAVLDTGITPRHEAFGVYEGMLEDAAITEEAAKAQIDTLGRGAWLSSKIPFSYDYADYDDDATDDHSGHGTHVSAIAAGYAETEDGGVKFCGAAPDAQILAMKIFPSQEEGTTSAIYFAALEDAYLLGADVVNMSIGSQNGFSFDPDLENELYGNIFQTLRDNGVAVIVAAGNEGSQADYALNKAGPGYLTADYTDYGTVGAPSTYAANLSVASAENARYPSFRMLAGDREIPYYDSTGNAFYNTLSGLDSVEFAVVPGFGAKEDFAGLMVAGRVALIARGEITFAEKINNAAKAGAIAAIVYNSDDSLLGMALDDRKIPAVMVSQADGAYLRSLTETVEPDPEDLNKITLYETDFFNDTGRNLIAFPAYDAAIKTSVSDGKLETRSVEIKTGIIEEDDYQREVLTVTVDPAHLCWAPNWDEDGYHFSGFDGDGFLALLEDGSLSLTEEPVGAWLYNEWVDDDTGEFLGKTLSCVCDDEGNIKYLKYTDDGVALCQMDEAEIDRYLLSIFTEPEEPAATPVATDIGSLRLSEEPVITENEEGGRMSSFSSWGPTPDLQFKPQITAIGGSVYAASFGTEDGYELMSGTSMATPDMAGCTAALMQYIKQSYPEVDRKQRTELALALLESSAALLTDAEGEIYSVRKQGAGLIDLTAATTAKAYLTEPLLTPGARADGIYTLRFTVRSLGEAVSYRIDTKAMTDKLVQMDTGLYNTMQSEALTAADFTVTTDAENDLIAVPAGGTVDVTVTITLSDAVKTRFAAQFPNGSFIDGFVELTEVAPVPSGSFRFDDVQDESQYYFEPVYWAYEHDPRITSGTSATTFSPDASCTRCQTVTFLWAAFGKPTPKTTENPFTDVPEDAYYRNAVLWAYENHITAGTTPTTFSPEDPCTRSQTVTFLWASLGKPAPKTTENPFDDVREDAYYRNAVLWAYENHITAGTSATTFSPENLCVRAQIVTFLHGYLASPDGLEPVRDAASIHASFLGFYGDWSKAPIAEQTDWRDVIYAIRESAQTGEDYLSLTDAEVNTGVNMAYVANNTFLTYFGALFGAYAGESVFNTGDYSDTHIAISRDSLFDSLYVEPRLLRNARRVIMTVTDVDSGELVYHDQKEYVSKSFFYPEAGGWVSSIYFLFSGVDMNNNVLPHGSRLRVDLYASLDYGEDVLGTIAYEDLAEQGAAYRFWSIPLRLDYAKPTLDAVSYDPEAKQLTVTASDDQYLAGLRLMRYVQGVDDNGDPAETTEIQEDVPFSDAEEGLSHTVVFDNVEEGEKYALYAVDYAANETGIMVIPGAGEMVCVELQYMAYTGLESGMPRILAAKGTQLTLPNVVTSSYDADYQFYGWMTAPIDGSLSEEAMAGLENAPIPAGGSYTVTGAATLYAAYRQPVSDPNHLLARMQEERFDWAGVYAFSGFDKDDPSKNLFLNSALEAVELAVDTDEETGEEMLWNTADEFLFEAEEHDLPLYDDWLQVLWAFRSRETGDYLCYEDGVLTTKEECDESCMWNINYWDSEHFCVISKESEWALFFDRNQGSFGLIPYDTADYDDLRFSFWQPKPFTNIYFTELPE